MTKTTRMDWNARQANAKLCRRRALQMLDGTTVNVPDRLHDCVTTQLRRLAQQCNYFAQQRFQGGAVVPVAPNLQRCVHSRLQQKKKKKNVTASSSRP